MGIDRKKQDAYNFMESIEAEVTSGSEPVSEQGRVQALQVFCRQMVR